MSRVVLENIFKTYPGTAGGTPAVRGVSLTIADGEFMVLVGPSGCGKSTLLRLVAGLETADAGTISIADRVVNDIPPKDRDLAMVFQNYALYPHLTVFDNLAFGLKLRKLPRAQIAERVRAAAVQLGLADVLDRLPKALSGGQRQRVAVGRAMVRQPKVFLFDEPLSNLDAKLRAATRAEIARLHARLGATMIYVTHDQVEAMTMGDRICVMKGGEIQQVAAPLELYNSPVNLFVAGFIGSPPMNFLAGTIEKSATGLDFVATNSVVSNFRLQISGPTLAALAARHVGKSVILGLRPEHLSDTRTSDSNPASKTLTSPPATSAILATIEVCEPMGAETFLHLTTPAGPLVARVAPGPRHAVGDTITLTLALDHAHLFDPVTGLALS
jgi:multiple sugar transport system ATP-binding protein